MAEWLLAGGTKADEVLKKIKSFFSLSVIGVKVLLFSSFEQLLSINDDAKTTMPSFS